MADLVCETRLWAAGFQAVAGVDEAGRGPLAGPVVAAAVIFPAGCSVEGVEDSKLLAPARRRELAIGIQGASLAWAVAAADPREIDRWNILRASRLAMRRALARLAVAPDHVLIDGLPGLPWPQWALIGGDRTSATIAAASILAKLFRDLWMEEAARRYPVYGFERHKGYPTAAHRAALARFGPSPLHRRSFRGAAGER